MAEHVLAKDGARFRLPLAAMKQKLLSFPAIGLYGPTLGFLGFAVLLLLAQGFEPSSQESIFTLRYYAGMFLGPLRTLNQWIVFPVIVVLLFIFWRVALHAMLHNIHPREYISYLRQLRTREGLKDIALVAIALGINLALLGFILGKLNTLNASRLKSDLLLSWDYWLTGTYPFVVIGAVTFPAWVVAITKYAFFILPFTVSLAGVYLFIQQRHIFYEYSVAFIVGLLIMLPFWAALPALDPRNQYIENVYNIPLEASIISATRAYAPQQEIAAFQNEIRKIQSRNPKNIYPTSAFPSAHVAWAFMMLWYARRARTALFWWLAPIAILSTFATVLFGFHYFVDIPSGIAAGAVAIYITAHLKKISSRQLAPAWTGE